MPKIKHKYAVKVERTGYTVSKTGGTGSHRAPSFTVHITASDKKTAEALADTKYDGRRITLKNGLQVLYRVDKTTAKKITPKK